jgi:hypothetical protein
VEVPVVSICALSVACAVFAADASGQGAAQDAPAASARVFDIDDAPSIGGFEFAPDKFARCVNTLVALGEEKACSALEGVASAHPALQRSVRSGEDMLRASRQEQRVMLLCRALFVAREGHPVRGPGLGAPDLPIRSMKSEDWPYIPLAFSQGVALLLARGYILGGCPESSGQYLEYCRKNGRFRTEPLPVPTHREAEDALLALFASSRWKKIKWRDRGRGWSYSMDEDWKKRRVFAQVLVMDASPSWDQAEPKSVVMPCRWDMSEPVSAVLPLVIADSLDLKLFPLLSRPARKDVSTAAEAYEQMREAYPEPPFPCALSCWTQVGDLYVFSVGFSGLVRGYYAKVLWIGPGDSHFRYFDFTSDPALFGDLLRRSGRKDLYERFTPEGDYWRPSRSARPLESGHQR